MGDNYYLGDRNGVRTPMQWGPSINAGFSRANPQRLYLPAIIDPEYHYESINVDNQEKNLSSLLWWMKRVIAMRKNYKAFSRGSLEFISSNNPKILSFVRQYQDEIILVVINLSRFTQVVELDLAKYSGFTPQEVFGQNKFPAVKESPYVLTLSPHSHYWLLMKKEVAGVKEDKIVSPMAVGENWENVLENKQRERLEQEVLPKYIKTCRWFGAKAKTIRKVRIVDNARADSARLLLLEVSYTEGSPELYFLPLSFILKNQAHKILEEFPQSVIAPLKVGEEEGILYDSIYDENFRKALLLTIAHRRKIKGTAGEFFAYAGRKFRGLLDEKGVLLSSQPLKAEQTNTSVNYENKFYLKLYRRLDEGINPELEIVRFLTEKTAFPNIPPFAGAVEYIRKGGEAITVGMLQGYITNAGDAWTYSLDEAAGYFERILSRKDEIKLPEASSLMQDLVGGMYPEMVSLLGKRTAELHIALGTLSGEESFEPEPFSTHYQRSLYQSMQGLVRKTMQLLSRNLKNIPEVIRGEAESVLAAEGKILKLMQGSILQKKISTVKTRIHGDYHLGQVLYTGKDFMIMDFEGEPARPLSERRLKHSPLKDVAGMIRSFHYAAHGPLFLRASFRTEDVPFLESWIGPWCNYIGGVFLDAYLSSAAAAPFIPKEIEESQSLLYFFLMEKAVYELFYELNNRPDWAIIPVKGINYILSNFAK
jgi:maltose alpha-D-glucosyltransferase/alpha-amylase